MSGIAGIWNLDGKPVDPELLQPMAEAAAHRGPDGIRYWIDGNVGLAHLALNVTPESFREHQPSANRAGACWITANARIDNRDELIRTFTSQGIYLSDPTDVDLILAAYDLWGEACASKLLGDFAFAIWDAPRCQLFAVRDTFGCRPFYYRQTPTVFAWASEVKQLLVDSSVDRSLNERVLGAHLCAHAQPQDETFYLAVRQLPPGHALRLDVNGLHIWRHSDLMPEREIRYARVEDYAAHLRELFFDAVRVRLRSVKPVFIKLSGGIDSSCITATAAHLARSEPGIPPIHALHVTYDELPDADEQRYARPLVEHCGVPTCWVPGDGLWPFRDYPDQPPDEDGPDVGPYMYWNRTLVRLAAERGAGVVLSGYWGDPIVQGSVFGFADLLARLRLGEWLRGIMEFRYNRGKPYRPLRRLIFDYSIRPLVPDWLKNLWRAVRVRDRSLIPHWIEPEFVHRIGLADLIKPIQYPGHAGSRARRAIYTTIMADIAPRGAIKLDQLGMRLGVDYRYPFIDIRLIRFALAIPPDLWFRGGIEKVLLRQALGEYLPAVIRNRTQIITISALFDRAMRDREVPKIRALASCPLLTQMGIVIGDRTSEHYEQYVRGEIAVEHPFAWILTAEMWLQQHFAD
jgi:asparagine synthase (glutamine-hydrolysing)